MTSTQHKLVIGLTGGIGSGKTAASQWFETQGVCVVDTDVIARKVVELGSPALVEIQAAFGPHVLQADGTLDRAALRHIVFNNSQQLKTLEQILHPRIHQQIITELNESTSAYTILVSALLLEGDQHQLVNRILLIDAPEHLQVARASDRDGQSAENIGKIIAKQMPRAEKLTRADDVINNNKDLQQLYTTLAEYHQRYLQLAMTHGKVS